MLLELGSYWFKHIVLCPNSGELILLAQCCKPTNCINLEIICKWMRWNSPATGFKRQKHFVFPKPTLSSCRTTVSSRRVLLPADLDFALPGKWKDISRWSSRPCLKNPSKSASIRKLYQSVNAILGQSISITVGLSKFDLHLLCVTLSKSFLWEYFLSRSVLCRRYQRWERGL